MVSDVDKKFIAEVKFKRSSDKTYQYIVPPEVLETVEKAGYTFFDSEQIKKDGILYFLDNSPFLAKVSTPYEKDAKVLIKCIYKEGFGPWGSEMKATKSLSSVYYKFLDFIKEEKPKTSSSEGFWDNYTLLKEDSLSGTDYKISDPSKNKNKKGDNKTMKNMFKNIKGFDNIGMVEGVFGLSLIDNKQAVKIGDSFYSFDKESNTLTDASSFVMEMPVPAMVLPAQVKDLKKGDIILHEGTYVFVKDIQENSNLVVITADGEQKTKTLVKNVLMGNLSFVERLTSPFGDMLSNGNQNGNGGMFGNPMVMMMMMGGMGDSSDSKMDGMMQAMMMSQMMGNSFAPQSQEEKSDK